MIYRTRAIHRIARNYAQPILTSRRFAIRFPYLLYTPQSGITCTLQFTTRTAFVASEIATKNAIEIYYVPPNECVIEDYRGIDDENSISNEEIRFAYETS